VIEAGDVLFDVGAGLVDLVEEGHLLLDEVDDVVDVAAVARDDLLFLLEDLLDQFLMLRAQGVRVVRVLRLQLIYSRHRIVQVH
jgi:hypothetical protein